MQLVFRLYIEDIEEANRAPAALNEPCAKFAELSDPAPLPTFVEA